MTPGAPWRAAAVRAYMSLTAAAALAAVFTGGALWLVRLVTGVPSLRLIATVVSAAVLLGPAGGFLGGPRRVSGNTLVVAAWAVATALTVMAGLTGTVLLLGHMPDDAEQMVMGPAVAGIALATILAAPLSRRVIHAVRRLAPPAGGIPDDLLAVFAARAAGSAALTELLRELAEALRRSWQLSTVQVWTAEQDSLRCTVSVPAITGTRSAVGADDLYLFRRVTVAGPGWLQIWMPSLLQGRTAGQLRLAPAVHGDETLALVIIERDADADRFNEAEERALAEVAHRLGIVLRNRELNEQLHDTLHDLRRTNAELRASRTRLVTAADAARVRIERDLHDGAQQHLVRLGFDLGRLRDTLRRTTSFNGPDRDACMSHLDTLEQRVQHTGDALRDLARGIYPSVLTDFGLPNALRAVAERSTSPVTVEVADVSRYAPEVEAAVYFCCLEALQNATKHAEGASVAVRLWSAASELRLLVVDDGAGFDPESVHDGRGLQNMADRLGALGGSLSCASAPGRGTTIHGTLPLPAES